MDALNNMLNFLTVFIAVAIKNGFRCPLMIDPPSIHRGFRQDSERNVLKDISWIPIRKKFGSQFESSI